MGHVTRAVGQCQACQHVDPPPDSTTFLSPQAEAYKQRTALPFTPAVVTFTNVEYSVPLPPVSSNCLAP